MIRTFALAAGLAVLSLAGAAAAQNYAPSWGQPVYLDAYGRPVGGTPLSEVETRSYVETGYWADGYNEQPYVYVPGRAPAYGYGGYRSRGYGYDRRPDQGYRDEWGYDDDRARPGRRGYVRGHSDDRNCDCPDVYFRDR
ncbi:hypothetical protein [Brevundimonas lenta]|uniref:Uncharacterized protein n=1 Tax=Brevundimonas lenta TaxID=424796 RepID=A0A7W6JBS2_9CAUL|nr:hypothetical protein [Brevundimonas lenta]MBB4081268.1 hypothetical protein [Brevundimonas lenta]